MSTANINPAANLLQKRNLPNGWRVLRRVSRGDADTGANFSFGYNVVSESGREGFLKALDLSSALKQPDVTRVLSNLLDAFVYERDLLILCRDNNLDHIAATIDYGQIPVGDFHDTLPVPYLIFELADGDIRSKLDLSDRFELAFCLRALHHCTVGLHQLHNHGIAHQDLKPSNVLVFDDSYCRVTDLGSSTQRGIESPRDGFNIPGDLRYAPPELLYGNKSSEWGVGRLASDLYHLGSLAVFFFIKVGITPMWILNLADEFRPNKWGQTYEQVLPYVRAAHELAFAAFEEEVPTEIRGRLGAAVRQLCDPDPGLRGHPQNRAANLNPYSLERYISIFDFLAKRAEWQMRKSLI